MRTEKKDGCNRIKCVKCKYQWCWLCGGKYTSGHFDIGDSCVGLRYDNIFTNNCFILYIYKFSIVFSKFLLMIIGFLPVIIFIIFYKIHDLPNDNECLMKIYF